MPESKSVEKKQSKAGGMLHSFTTCVFLRPALLHQGFATVFAIAKKLQSVADYLKASVFDRGGGLLHRAVIQGDDFMAFYTGGIMLMLQSVKFIQRHIAVYQAGFYDYILFYEKLQYSIHGRQPCRSGPVQLVYRGAYFHRTQWSLCVLQHRKDAFTLLGSLDALRPLQLFSAHNFTS
jgi:hypothetical protein